MQQLSTVDKVRVAVCSIGYVKGKGEELENPIKIDEGYEIVGTGFLIDDSVVLTNRHVIEILLEKVKYLENPEKRLFLSFVYPYGSIDKWQQAYCRIKKCGTLVEKKLDIGLIEFKRRPDKEFEICQSPTVATNMDFSIGEEIGVCGYPSGNDLLKIQDYNFDIRRFGVAFQHGRISAVAPFETVEEPTELLLDVSCAGGMSGAPVFRLSTGDIIGVFFCGDNKMSFAIPLNKKNVENWKEQLR